MTFSLTRRPPVSSAAFQVRPQSLRFTVTAPSKPTRVLPHGSTAVPVSSKGIVTGCVMMSGYMLVTAILSGVIRDHTPAGKAGHFQGIQMIFGGLLAVGLAISG